MSGGSWWEQQLQVTASTQHAPCSLPCTRSSYRHNGHTESLLAGMCFYCYTSVSLFILSQTSHQLGRWMISVQNIHLWTLPSPPPHFYVRQSEHLLAITIWKSLTENMRVFMLCIHHERRNVFWTDQQLVIRIDPIASQLNAESALTGIAANTSLHDVSRYQQYQKFFYF